MCLPSLLTLFFSSTALVVLEFTWHDYVEPLNATTALASSTTSLSTILWPSGISNCSWSLDSDASHHMSAYASVNPLFSFTGVSWDFPHQIALLHQLQHHGILTPYEDFSDLNFSWIYHLSGSLLIIMSLSHLTSLSLHTWFHTRRLIGPDKGASTTWIITIWLLLPQQHLYPPLFHLSVFLLL